MQDRKQQDRRFAQVPADAMRADGVFTDRRQQDRRTDAPAQHTPGPWDMQLEDYRDYCGHQIHGANDRLVATTECEDAAEVTPEDTANARLITAAPDLLASLVALRAALREHIKFDVKKHYHLMVADVSADKAIRKAEGTE